MARWIVFGDGLLGWHVANTLEKKGIGHEVLGHAAIDAEGGLEGAARARVHPGDVLVNAAALTNVDACEAHVEEAMLVNGEMPGRLAAHCGDVGALLVHISTDAVLDVTNVYARSKQLGEQRIRDVAHDGTLIVRTSTNFGPHPRRRDFVQWVVETLRTKGHLRVLTDMRSSPTYVPDAARALVALVDQGVRGTQQVVNHPGLSRYDFARLIQRAWDLPGEIEPMRMAEFAGFTAPRPMDTSMASTVEEWARPMPLDECLRDYRARSP